MSEIVVSEFMDEAAVERCREVHDVCYEPTLVERREELLLRLAAARALIVRNRTRVDGELLEAAPRLAVVGRLGVGLDNIDLEACAQHGVAVRAAEGANAASVAEYVMAALLVLCRPLLLQSARTAAGEWPRTEGIGREVAELRLGLLGFGTTGREVARRARALDMAVAAHDPAIPDGDPLWARHGVVPLPFEELLAWSEALSLHVPLLPTTRRLIDERAIRRMPPGALLVNAARGGVVHEAALAEALRQGRLGGAALDVFETEPLPADNRLEACPNLLLTPHVAGLTAESNRRVGMHVAEAVLEELSRGQQRTSHNPEKSG